MKRLLFILLLAGCSSAQIVNNGASGSGTVTHTGGALTSGKCAYGAGADDLAVDASCSLDGSGNLGVTSITYTGAALGPQQTATNDATKPLANKAMKWVATNGWTIAVSGTDMTDPSLAIAYADASGSLVRPQGYPSQISAVSAAAVTTGQYALLYGTAGSDGQLTSSATCTPGYRYLGTWAVTAAAGTRTLNYNPGICGVDHVISFHITQTGALDVPKVVMFGCNIYKWDITAKPSGSPSVIVCKKNGSAPSCSNPTYTDKISASDPVTIAGATQATDHTPSGWTTAVAVGDQFDIDATTMSTSTAVDVQLRCR